MTDSGSEPGESDGDDPSVEAALRAGAALFNEGYWLAAHEPWEAAWLPLDRDADGAEAADERLLHGLIQVAAATHHARAGNGSGAVGCAEGAVSYLDGLGDRHRSLELEPLRRWCRRIADASTPDEAGTHASEAGTHTSEAAASVGRPAPFEPPAFRIDGTAVRFADLEFEATLAAAPALAEAIDVVDPEVVAMAVELAREERGTGRTRFAELLIGFLREPDTRRQVAVRLGDHVERAARKRRDVDDLF